MYIEKVNLENFRNYESQEINFINGINLFVGNNAQGKTNIIESIYVSAFGKSYRASKDMELINFNKDFFRINLNYKKNNINSKIEIFVDKNNRKSIKENGVKISKIADHVGSLLVIIFSPDSLDIVKGSTSKRRNFIDVICSQLSKSYLIAYQEYMKCLKLKNAMLKKDIVDKDYIYILHEKMSEDIYKIVRSRNDIINKLLKKSKIIQSNLTNNEEDIDLIYQTDFLNKSKDEIKMYLDEHLYIDILRKSSVKGIQRDDLLININGEDVSKYGSQGQKRTALLTLKLANFEVFIDEKDDIPILLLDDIMSELDSKRISFLLKYIENYQSIITTTDASFVKDVKNIVISSVKCGKVE